MKFAKLSLSSIVCSMLALNFPLVTSAADATAEYNLVQSVEAMSAQQLTPAQTQASLSTALATYQQNAIQDGQQETRLVNALVDSHVYSAVQAQVLFSSALNASKQSLSVDASNDAIAATLSQLAQTQLTGGQFSACNNAATGVLAVSVAAVITGAFFYDSGRTACPNNAGGNNADIGCVNTGQNAGSNHTLGEGLYIGGAVGMVAGALLLIEARATGC